MLKLVRIKAVIVNKSQIQNQVKIYLKLYIYLYKIIYEIMGSKNCTFLGGLKAEAFFKPW